MIAGMLNLDHRHSSILIVVIERENLDRIKKADPITMGSVKKGGWLEIPKYPQDFSIFLAYEEDQDELYRRARADRGKFLEWLERGRVFIKDVDGVEHTFKIPEDKEKSDAE
jgi:hypothetical protein